jgi:DNA-binding NarL/FixJ family response regulator
VAQGRKFSVPAANTERESSVLRGLTPRQAEIIRLLALGRSNPEIAHECGMSVRTVESHRARIRRQVGADSLSELTRFAHDQGLIC